MASKKLNSLETFSEGPSSSVGSLSIEDFCSLASATGALRKKPYSEWSSSEVREVVRTIANQPRFRNVAKPIFDDSDDSLCAGFVDVLVGFANFLERLAKPGQDRPTQFSVLKISAPTEYRFSIDHDGHFFRDERPRAKITSTLLGRLLRLLDESDASLFRRCAYSRCQRVFYARRRDQRCCSTQHNNNLLQREWYKTHGKAAKYRTQKS